MNKIISLIIFYIFIIGNSSAIGNENKILIKLNNDIITSIDLVNEILYLKSINPDLVKAKNSQIIEIAKRSLVKDRIKLLKLKEVYKKIEIKDEFFNNLAINSFKYLNINSINEFDNYFLNYGINPDDVRKKITIKVLWNQFIYRKFNQNVKIDKEKIINDIKEKNNSQKEFFLYEILISNNNKQDIEELLRKIKKNIAEKSFSEAALNFSISDSAKLGGKLGWIQEAILSENIKNELKKISKGNYTKPIVVPGGFLILYKENTRNIKIDLEKEIENIIAEKTNEQLDQFSNIFFNKTKKNININEL